MNRFNKAENLTYTIYLTFLYCCCFILVVCFVNTYDFYILIRNQFGESFILITPYLLTIFVLSAFLVSTLLNRKNNQIPLMPSWILCGVTLAFAALFIPDPNFAIKRIHVFEYLLLSILVRFTLSHRLSAINLFLFSSLLTILFGVHDEFLQGLHPARTYGLRDIAVNSVSALAGNCIWHGVNLFPGNLNEQLEPFQLRKETPSIAYTSWLTTAIFLFLVPFTVLKNSTIPSWVVLPLVSAMIAWGILCNSIPKRIHHGVNAISVLGFLLLIYPVVINVFQIPFR